MKKNIINTFLAVAITLMAILFFNSMTAVFKAKPIFVETEYVCEKKLTGYNGQVKETCTYIFHSDGTFEQIRIVEGGEERKAYGMYAVSGKAIMYYNGEIRLFYTIDPYNLAVINILSIKDNGATLEGSGIYKAGIYKTRLYAVIAGISEIGLIAAVFVVNRNAVNCKKKDDE